MLTGIPCCYAPIPLVLRQKEGIEKTFICYYKVDHSNCPSFSSWMSDASTGHIGKDSSLEVSSKLAILLIFFQSHFQLSIICYLLLALLAQSHNCSQQLYSLNFFYPFLDPFIPGDPLHYDFVISQFVGTKLAHG